MVTIIPMLTSTVDNMTAGSIVCFKLNPPPLSLKRLLVAGGALDEDVVEVCNVEVCGVEAVVADCSSADADDIDVETT
jgi:hypothetical protein